MRVKDKKKLEIIKAAEKRFIRHGLHKTTLDEIARDLRIGKSTLYHYFETKEDLYYQTLENQSDEYILVIKAILKSEELQYIDKVKEYFLVRKGFSQSYKLLFQMLLLLINEKTTPIEEELLTKFHTAEIKLIADFFISVFPSLPGDEIKRKANRFMFLLLSISSMNPFFGKIGIEISDDKSIELLLADI